MGMKTKREPLALSCRRIMILADVVALRYGLKKVERRDVRWMYDSRVPMPVITRCAEGDLWVDKYYIAYKLMDNVVRYAYLTRHHIHEEMTSFAEVAKARGKVNRIAPDIRSAFDKAYLHMEGNRKNIWISGEVERTEKSRRSSTRMAP